MERSWTHRDKSEWGDGPWQDEPDKVVWVDETTGLDCMIHRGPPGALCGYVGVPRSHPWYGRQFDDDVYREVDVHGGLSYGAPCDPDGTEESGICHVPALGREHDLWWVGFSCSGYLTDMAPCVEADLRRMYEAHPEWAPNSWAGLPKTYKPVAYVRDEVQRLAQHAAAL